MRVSQEPSPYGVVIAGVQPRGPAAQAGMQDADVIVQVADQFVRDVQTLRSALLRLEAGKTVPVVVLRDGEKVVLKVTLGQSRRP